MRRRAAWLAIACLAGCGGEPEPKADARPAGHRRMLAALEDVLRRTPDENQWLGDLRARTLRAKLAAARGMSPGDRCGLLLELGNRELMLGNEQAAIRHLEDAVSLLPRISADGRARFDSGLKLAWRSDERDDLFFILGVAYLRRAETLNCCGRHTPESCIAPIKGGGIHTLKESSQRAMAAFTKVLDTTSTAENLHRRALWLLNIAAMTIDLWPDGVPEPYRIPRASFDSDEEFPRFANIANHLGMDTFNLSGGAIAEDFDNDGYLDLLVTTYDPAGGPHFFRNNRDGTFADRTEEAGLTGLLGGLNMVQADYDNDGDVDVLVLRGAWLAAAGRHPNSLLRNDGSARFTDVTFEAGLGDVYYPTQTADWADYDNDGDLDLYIGNEYTTRATAHGQLFQNNGDGTFRDVAVRAGVTNDRWAKAVSWGDYDGDGDPDLFVSNLAGRNRLYRNNGDGTFTDVAEKLGVRWPRSSFPAWFWDYDNDGHLDLFVSAYATDIAALTIHHRGEQQEIERACIYRGDGGTRFTNLAPAMGLVRPNAPMGANFGDLDNDGYLDFYLGTGDPLIRNIMPNVMFRNRAGKSFADITTAGGFGHLQKGHAIVFADFDNDGDQDVFEQLGGAFAGDRYYDAFFENPGFGNHWIAVQLVGVKSNRSAIGARIRVVLADRSVYKHVNSGGSFGGNPLRQSIGLGKAESIKRLEVFWPTTGETQVFSSVPVDRFLRITEGQSKYETLDLKRLRLR